MDVDTEEQGMQSTVTSPQLTSMSEQAAMISFCQIHHKGSNDVA